MSAPNDRLIGIVGVEVQASPRKDPGEDIAGSGDSLPRGASNGYREGMLHPSPLDASHDVTVVMMPKAQRPATSIATQPHLAGIRGRAYQRPPVPSKDEKISFSVFPIWAGGKGSEPRGLRKNLEQTGPHRNIRVCTHWERASGVSSSVWPFRCYCTDSAPPARFFWR